MFVGKHVVKKNNLNQLYDAYHQYYGLVLVDGCTVLRMSFFQIGSVAGNIFKLGVFSDNVVSVAWSNGVLMDVFMSVQLRSKVIVFSVCSDSDSKPVFTQINTFEIQSKSGCCWHATKPVICIFYEDQLDVHNVTTNRSQKLKYDGVKVTAGLWTPDGSRLMIAIGTILKIYYCDDLSLVSEACAVEIKQIDVIRNIVAISDQLVAIATDLPLKHLIKASQEDMFDVQVQQEIPEKTLEIHESFEQRKVCKMSGDALPSSASCVSLLSNKIDLKNKGCINLTELLTKMDRVNIMQDPGGGNYVSDDCDNDRFRLKTSGIEESITDEQDLCDIDLINIKADDLHPSKDTTSNLLQLKRKQNDVTDSSKLLIIDMKQGVTLSEVNVPCIINPDLLTYLPRSNCIVIGSNSQSSLSIYKWEQLLVRGKTLDLRPDERPLGIVAVSPDTLMLMSTKSEKQNYNAAFFSASIFEPVDVHIKTMKIEHEALDLVKPYKEVSDLPFLQLPTGNRHPTNQERGNGTTKLIEEINDTEEAYKPTGNRHPTKQERGNGTTKLIEEINDTEEAYKKDFMEKKGQNLPKKDVGVQCQCKNYPYPAEAPLIHLRSEKISKSFILEDGRYLKLEDVKMAFKFSTPVILIGRKWVHLSEDSDGLVKMTFKPGSSHQINEV